MEENDQSSSFSQKKSIGKKICSCKILLLNGQDYICDVPKQSKGEVLIKEVLQMLNIEETDYFGLYYQDISNNKYWLEPNKSIKKQIKNGPWAFYFAVKFYPPDPSQLHQDLTRYFIVLQLRDDIVSGRLPCSFVTHALLGSYVVQSELGDYNSAVMTGNYVSDFDIAPNQSVELEHRIKELHETHKGQTPEIAELNFLESAKKLPLYGVDLHPAKDSEGISVYVGISWNGVHVYRDGTLINRFAWPGVVKLSYVRKKFYVTIRPLDSKNDSTYSMVGFRMIDHGSAKRLWKSSVEHHAFFRLVRNDKRRPSKLVRVGSKFQYRGRTQTEARKAFSKDESGPQPSVKRVPSRRRKPNGVENKDSSNSSTVQVNDAAPTVVETVPPPLPKKKKDQQQIDTATAECNGVENETVLQQPCPIVREQEDTIEIATEHVLGERNTSTLKSVSSTVSYDSNPECDKDSDSISPYRKSIQKMRQDFLSSPSTFSAKASSMSSLEALDARLPPVTSEDERDTTHDDDDDLSSDSDKDTESLHREYSNDQSHRRQSSSSSSSDSPSECSAPEGYPTPDETASPIHHHQNDATESDVPYDGEACEETEEAEDQQVVVESSSVEEPNCESLDAEDNNQTCSNPTVNYTEAEEHPLTCTRSITIVETKAVSVEQVVIPQNENEVHQVSLSQDDDDGYIISPPPFYNDNNDDTADSSTDESPLQSIEEQPVANFTAPPTVKTEAVVVVDSFVEDTPEGTTDPPVVRTETKTITYESAVTDSSSGEMCGVNDVTTTVKSPSSELVTSQTISSETEYCVTTTEITKVITDGVSEVTIEKSIVSHGDDADIDHNMILADAIRDTCMDENQQITKIVLEESSVAESE